MQIFSISIFTSYLLRRNLFYMFVSLFMTMGIYLLVDVFERLDHFFVAGVDGFLIIQYFLFKIPLIISQTLPVIFLLSLVVQLSILKRTKELLALQAGGLRPIKLILFFIIYALLWSLITLLFSDVIGVEGAKKSEQIWKQNSSKNSSDNKIEDVWAKEKNYILHADFVNVTQRYGKNLSVFAVNEKMDELFLALTAKKFTIKDSTWELEDVVMRDMQTFQRTKIANQTLPIKQYFDRYFPKISSIDSSFFTMQELYLSFSELKRIGVASNRLETNFYGRISYSFTMLLMALFALAIASYNFGLYSSIGVSLLCVFLFYITYMVGLGAGEESILNPIIAAFAGNIIFSFLALLRIVYHYSNMGYVFQKFLWEKDDKFMSFGHRG